MDTLDRGLLDGANGVDVAGERQADAFAGEPHEDVLALVERGAGREIGVEEGRYIAERITGARFVELSGEDHFVAIDPDQILDEVERFARSLPIADRRSPTPTSQADPP